jgi:flagellar basal-body rod modification protein FlgD
MIDATSLSGASYSSSASSASGATMGKNEFMTLLVAQLQHQDPLNPMQPHEFASQLANFSSVEQLSSLNAGMSEQLDSLRMAAALSKTSLSASLLGRTVLTDGNQVAVPEEGTANVTVDVGGNGGTGTLKIYDSTGNVVASRDLGSVAAGRQSFEVPDDIAPGTYTYKVEVKGADGEAVGVDLFVSGRVDRVLFDDGRILLRIGELDVDLETLVEIGSLEASGA